MMRPSESFSTRQQERQQLESAEVALWCAVIEMALRDWRYYKTFIGRGCRNYKRLGWQGQRPPTSAQLESIIGRLCWELEGFFYGHGPQTLKWIAEYVAPDPEAFCESVRGALI